MNNVEDKFYQTMIKLQKKLNYFKDIIIQDKYIKLICLNIFTQKLLMDIK